MPTDKAGMNIHEGQLVDVPMYRMMTGTVVQIAEKPIVIPDQPQMPPTVIVQFFVQLPIVNNRCHDVYVVKVAPKEKGENVVDFPDKSGKEA